jgi:uncharacterized protein with GYD domain
MAKYLFIANYTTQGLKGLFKDGGSKRKEDLGAAIRELGGSLECLYYAFGDHDVYSIAELPDNVSTAAVSMAINASGAATVKTVVLMAPEDIDKATKMTVGYRPPGQ